jgi:hypothetical protein
MNSPQAKLVAQRVVEAVHAGSEQCFACLAEHSGLDEHDVRAVALVLVCRAGLDLAHRRCSRCGSVEEMLVQRRAA